MSILREGDPRPSVRRYFISPAGNQSVIEVDNHGWVQMSDEALRTLFAAAGHTEVREVSTPDWSVGGAEWNLHTSPVPSHLWPTEPEPGMTFDYMGKTLTITKVTTRKIVFNDGTVARLLP